MNEALLYGLALAVVLEIATILGRLIFGSKKDQIAHMKKKPRVRIHHLYTGIFILLIYLVWPLDWIFILGFGLTLSDALHHFVVLPIWVGRTEFP